MQRAGLELMDMMVVYQEWAYERLCRWRFIYFSLIWLEHAVYFICVSYYKYEVWILISVGIIDINVKDRHFISSIFSKSLTSCFFVLRSTPHTHKLNVENWVTLTIQKLVSFWKLQCTTLGKDLSFSNIVQKR